jgi:hypothetical protein
LFDVSVSWAPRATPVLYERLIADPGAEFARLCGAVGAGAPGNVDEVLARHTTDAMRALSTNHVWHGRPGLWKQLIVPDLARLVRERHPEAFTAFGYEADADPALTPEVAEDRWAALSAVAAG